MAQILLENVKKVYQGNVTAVHDFNLEIKDKEFVVFVGPSGCGKSTTLRMVAGLEDITEGTISIDGEVVNDLQPKDRHISMVFQNYALYPHLTVFENMAFPLRLSREKRYIPLTEKEIAETTSKIEELNKKLETADENEKESIVSKIEEYNEMIQKGKCVKGFTADEIYDRVTNAAEILGITEYLTRKPRALSGGQRQRVAIGRAMVKDCKVFLMDEPLSNLDAKLRNQMRAEIILLRKRINTTFIYVTHDQTEAMTLGDRIVIMKDGVIMQVGTPSEVFDSPANLFVAEFIGAPKMNCLPTKLVEEDGKYYITPYGSKILVDGYKGDILKEKNIGSRDVIFGVRPEHITIADKPGPNTIKTTLLVNEMMGSELHLHVTLEDNKEMIVRVPTISLSDEQKKSMISGKEIYITFEGKVMHFFDNETEESLLG